MGYGPWGHKESDMTEQLTLIHSLSPENSPLEWVVCFNHFTDVENRHREAKPLVHGPFARKW